MLGNFCEFRYLGLVIVCFQLHSIIHSLHGPVVVVALSQARTRLPSRAKVAFGSEAVRAGRNGGLTTLVCNLHWPGNRPWYSTRGQLTTHLGNNVAVAETQRGMPEGLPVSGIWRICRATTPTCLAFSRR
jgi:hypothetical protein